MALTIARSETQLTTVAGTFTAMDNLMASTVSSSFVVPSGVSKLVSVDIGIAADAAEEFASFIRLAGNGMKDSEQFVNGPAITASAAGTTLGNTTKDTDFSVISGNSIECAIATTDVAVISASCVMTFQ